MKQKFQNKTDVSILKISHVMRQEQGSHKEAVPDGEMNTWRPASYQ